MGLWTPLGGGGRPPTAPTVRLPPRALVKAKETPRPAWSESFGQGQVQPIPGLRARHVLHSQERLIEWKGENVATAFGESQCPHGPCVLSGGGSRWPAPPGNAVEIGAVRGEWAHCFRWPGRDCPPNVGVCVVGQGSRRRRWWMRAPRVGLCRTIRSWPTSPGLGEGYPGQNEGQACGQELSLAPKDSTFCQDLDPHLNLFRRPQADSWLRFPSPQTPQELIA